MIFEVYNISSNLYNVYFDTYKNRLIIKIIFYIFISIIIEIVYLEKLWKLHKA